MQKTLMAFALAAAALMPGRLLAAEARDTMSTEEQDRLTAQQQIDAERARADQDRAQYATTDRNANALRKVNSPRQTSVEAEAGIADFNRDLGNRLHPGPAWGVRANVPIRSAIGVTVGYQGSATLTDDSQIGEVNSVRSNGGFAAARLQPPTLTRVTPYVFGGIGFMRNSVGDTSLALRSDTAGIIPAGAGIEGNITDHFVVGGRFTYDFMFDNELVANVQSVNADLWTGTLNAAYRF